MTVLRATEDDLYKLVGHCQKKVPNFTVHDGKRDSYLMNLIDGIVYPFNKLFMDNYVTTLIGSVFFPKGMIKRRPINAIEITGHEFIHADDAKRLTFPLFALLYLSTIPLFVMSLVAYGIFGCWAALLPLGWAAVYSTAVAISFKLRKVTGFPLLVLSILTAVGLSIWLDGWGALWLVGALVFLLPLPAPGRYWAEHRGYGASITFEIALYGRTEIDRKIKKFTGSDYYWMMPISVWVAAKLKSYETKARKGNVTDPAFLHVLEFIKDLKDRYEGETDGS